jgi:glutamine amidotransferase
MKSVAILDYGIGNVRSVSNALLEVGAKPEITRDPAQIAAADGVILPGVGAFPAGMELLHRHGLVPEIHRYVSTGRPFLGICLGMQLLFDRGLEFGTTVGLGLITGKVDRIPVTAKQARLPHIAWSTVTRNAGIPDMMFSGLGDAQCRFYFVHSYSAQEVSAQFVTGSVQYAGCSVTAAVQRANIWGTQFHPEKSGPSGLRLLSNFVNRC